MLHFVADRIYTVKKAHERDDKLSSEELRLLDSCVTYIHTLAMGREPNGLRVDMSEKGLR